MLLPSGWTSWMRIMTIPTGCNGCGLRRLLTDAGPSKLRGRGEDAAWSVSNTGCSNLRNMRWSTGIAYSLQPSHLQGGNRLSRLTRPGNGLWSVLWQVWTSPGRIFSQNPGLCRSQGLCGGNRTGEKAAFRSGGAKSSGNTGSTIRPGAAANSVILHRLPVVSDRFDRQSNSSQTSPSSCRPVLDGADR